MNSAALIVALLALASAAGGCRSHAPPVRPTAPAARPLAPNALVQAVLASPQGPGFGLFPSRVGRARCVIPAGGPAALRVRGTCSASARLRRGLSGQAIVVLTETWPWRSFHEAGSPRRRQRHSWSFVVLPSREVVARGESGDLPPQYAR